MTRQEILERLQSIRDKGNEALKLLESRPLSQAKAEIQSLAYWIKQELQVKVFVTTAGQEGLPDHRWIGFLRA